jgi:AAA+ ATPase superfamily predicted ATPase
MDNPFYISSYKSPEFFCDRKNEANKLKSALENGRNIVLLSSRRMGKTGLIKHLFYNLKSDKNVYTFYFDIMNTNSVNEFVNLLANTILGTFNSKSKRLFNNVLSFLTKFSPTLSFDSISGEPSISLKNISEQQSEASIEEIFNYLEKQNKHIYIAIDEFQQITNYTNKGFEAFLRSHIQHLNNVHFIYSGSQQHILIDMFNSYSRPFYQSSDFLKLERIPQKEYAKFIVEKFKKTKKQILINDVYKLLDWLDTYTFYVQNYFNKLWYISGKITTDKDIEKAKQYIIDEHNFIYSNMYNLLTSTQYNLLKSIALEKHVEQPTSQKFINKYNLGTTSTISSAIKILLSKELIYQENNVYKLYDVFLQKWFEKNNTRQ